MIIFRYKHLVLFIWYPVLWYMFGFLYGGLFVKVNLFDELFLLIDVEFE
jgi:hypothetical protein